MFDKHFIDRKNRRWDLDLTWASVQALKREIGLDIEELVPKQGDTKGASFQAFHDFITDGLRLFEALWVLLKTECEKQSITQEEFGAGFGGDTFEAAGMAFTQALIDFFPNHLRKALLRKVLEKGKAAMAIAGARLAKEMDKIDLETLVNTNVDEALKKSSGEQPGLPASPTPAPTA
jgi:hypothetical protein